MPRSKTKRPSSFRIPSQVVERLSLKAGDRVSVSLDQQGRLILRKARPLVPTRGTPGSEPSAA